MSQEAYVFEALRTPRSRGKSSGELHEVKPIDLVVTLMHELVRRTSLETSLIDDVILGCVTPIGDQGANIAKIAAQRAGWDIDVPGVQLNRFCASGLDAVNTAAMKVRSGWNDLVVAGGVESLSRVPRLITRSASTAIALAAAVPVTPIAPRHEGCASRIAPLPSFAMKRGDV